jgi:hypothetical protein
LKTVVVKNRLYSDVLMRIIGPDGKSTPLLLIRAGDQEPIENCPCLDLAIAAWTASYSSLVHLGKIEPNETYHEILQNVPPTPITKTDGAPAAKGAGVAYG